MKRFVILFAALWLAGGCAAYDVRVEKIKSATELKARMDKGNVQVIHALDAENYRKGHIPGAANIDYEKMTPQMLPATKESPLIFYCASPFCPVSRMAANKATSWGYSHVAVYEGGMSDWRSSGMPVDTGG